MEEKITRVPIKGIMRNASIAMIEDGACDELINLRFKEGSWRPVLAKTLLSTLPITFDKTYKHNVVCPYDVWIGYYYDTASSKKIYARINGTNTVLIDIGTETFVDISHINNYLIVWTTTNKYIFFWDDELYDPPTTPTGYTLLPDLPQIEMFVCDHSTVTAQLPYRRSFAEALAYFLGELEKLKAAGSYEGHMMIIAAYKLFDGTYIKHSQPYYIYLGSKTSDELTLQYAAMGIDGEYASVFCTNFNVAITWDGIYMGYPDVQLLFDADAINNHLKKYKGVVQSIDIFGTYPKSAYTIPEIDPSGGDDTPAAYPVSINNDAEFNEQQLTYYKIKSISLDSINENEDYPYVPVAISIPLPSPDEFQAMPTLSIDNFSNHKLISSKNIVYNSRMHLGDISTILGDGFNPFVNYASTNYFTHYTDVSNPAGWVYVEAIDLKMFIYIDTDYGEKIIEQDIEVHSYHEGANPHEIILKPFIVYPDIRCTRIDVYVKDTGSTAYSWWIGFDLKPHPLHNYSYKYTNYSDIFLSNTYTNPVYLTDYNGDDAESVPLASLPTPDFIINEPNRMQLSAINNPFLLPSINSYRVGNMDDVIYGISPSVAPVSENQFGQYPVYVFTKGAIYAMLVGENDVVYSSIIPVTNEVFDEDSQFLPVRGGVVYTCPRGLKYIEGRTVLDIDNFIREKAEDVLPQGAGSALYNLLTTQPTLPPPGDTTNEHLFTKLSIVPFLTWLNSCILAYDNVEDELYVANNINVSGTLMYDYCYVYNFLSQTWHKISNGYLDFVNLFPGYGGVVKGSTSFEIFDLSDEDGRTAQTLIITRPFKLNGSGYKKITKGFLRCQIGRYAGQFHFDFYVYGSVDGLTWKYISGKHILNSVSSVITNVVDIAINKNHISCKYFIFVFHGNIDEVSRISHIDIQYIDVANNKLR